jgi:hypothetical protein
VGAETKTVWVEDLGCCGDPFAVGSTVAWELQGVGHADRRFFASVFGDEIAARITDRLDRHEDNKRARLVSGVVRSIEAVSWQVHPLADDSPVTDAFGLYALPGSVVMVAKSAADQMDEVRGRPCMGYIVDLDVVSVGDERASLSF